MSDNILEFDESFQAAILGMMLKDKSFLLSAEGHISGKSFTDPHIAKLADIVFDYKKRYGESPVSKEEVATLVKQTFQGDYSAGQKHLSKLEVALVSTERFRPEVIRAHVSGWLKSIILKQEVEKMGVLYNARQFDKVSDTMGAALRKVQSVSFEKDERVQSGRLTDFYARMNAKNNVLCCTMGNDDFDELLRGGAKIEGAGRGADLSTRTRGGLLPGQTTVIMGPTNAGKTTTILTIAAANICMGKDVAIVGHEQSSDEMFDKIHRAIAGLMPPEFHRRIMDANDPLGAGIQSLIDKHLFYFHWVKSGEMYVEPVVNLIRNAHQRLVDSTGKGFDLVIDDYPGKLRAKEFSNKASSKRHEEMVYVYDQFVLAAKQDGYHCLLPAQVNREGFKVNRGDVSRMLDMGDAAGAFDLTHLVDNLMTINRSPDDAAKDRIKLYLAKSRSASTGVTYVSKTNFAMSRTHGWDLSYRIFRQGEKPTDEACNAFFGEMAEVVKPQSLFQNATPARPRSMEDVQLSLQLKQLVAAYDTTEQYGDEYPSLFLED